jgi:penicillin-binding protein 1A
MVGAYQAIANGGIAKKPVYLTRIEDRVGKVLYERESLPEESSICTPENAELMIEMLRGVANEGTAAGLRSKYGITSDVAGKTGTTQNNTDGWFIGFTPGLVAGAWVGGDLQNVRFKSITYGQGAYAAMPMWAGFMKSTFKDDRWKYLQKEIFQISDSTRNQLICEDFLEKKPSQFKPIQKLKEKKFFKRLFRKRRKD